MEDKGWTDEELQRIHDFRHVFGGEQGERVLEYLKKECYFYKTTFVPGDPHATARNEGAREIVLIINYLITQRAERALVTRSASYLEDDDNG